MSREKGQTSFEYIFMLAVVTIIAVSAMTKIKDYLINNPNGVFNSYLSGYQRILNNNSGSMQGMYKRFSVRK